MFRPIPLYLFAVIAFSEYAFPHTTIGSTTGLILWLCVIPAFSVVMAAVMTCRARSNQRGSMISIITLVASTIIILSWSVAVFLMSWVKFVRMQIGNTVILDEIVVLIPVIAALACLWFVTAQRGTRLAWALHRFRLDILILSIPMFFLWGIRETAIHFGYTNHLMIIDVGGILLILFFSPFLIAAILPARKLQDQELRQSVLDIGSRAGVRLCNVLVWDTRHRLMNAMAIGVIPWWRSVILSDKLISGLSPTELLAVTGHEVGHHRHKHLLFLCLAVFGVLLWSDWMIERLLPTHEFIALVAFQLPLVIGTMVMVSRKFERQADIYAATDLSVLQGSSVITTSAAMAMSDALSVIAWTHNIPLARNEPMHGSIESRQQHLTRMIGQSIADLSINHVVKRMKIWIMILIVSGVLL